MHEGKGPPAGPSWHRRAAEARPALHTARAPPHVRGAPPFALRVAGEGRVVAYSGDTEWTESLIDAARGADLFIAEALFYHLRRLGVTFRLGEKVTRVGRDATRNRVFAELESGKKVLSDACCMQ